MFFFGDPLSFPRASVKERSSGRTSFKMIRFLVKIFIVASAMLISGAKV